MKGFPTQPAAMLAADAAPRTWLIEHLWCEQAVGIIGGEPKCGKSFLALDIAVCVASGSACLRHFAVMQTGPVLLFAAEDAPHIVRQRLQGIASAAKVDFDSLDIQVITAPRLRLDQRSDRDDLRDTVERLRPRLLILDPFVRLHNIDENAASEVAPLLGFLRSLQRQFSTAVVLVHHARKGAAGMRGGQALRGSSELHAWGDSNLYLRHHKNSIYLNIEHRAAASCDDLRLELKSESPVLALQVASSAPDAAPASPRERIEDLLLQSEAPRSQRELRAMACLRAETVGKILNDLTNQGRVSRCPQGYKLNR